MNREIKLRTFVIAMIIFVGFEVLLFFAFRPVTDENSYCQEAVCNEDASLCYAYDLDEEGNTVVVWRGSCQAGN